MYVKFDDNISTEEKQNLILYSGLSMCIANVRAYISNITSYYPLGKYTFPSIDLNALILSKKNNYNHIPQTSGAIVVQCM